MWPRSDRAPKARRYVGPALEKCQQAMHTAIRKALEDNMSELIEGAAPLPQRPTLRGDRAPITTHGQAIDAALHRRDDELTAILDALLPDQLYAIANAADRLRRACEAVHNGGQGEAPHHGRTRWDFQA